MISQRHFDFMPEHAQLKPEWLSECTYTVIANDEHAGNVQRWHFLIELVSGTQTLPCGQRENGILHKTYYANFFSVETFF